MTIANAECVASNHNIKPSYYLAFYKGTGRLDDRIIRFSTKSEFSHVELVQAHHANLVKSGTIPAISASGRDGGVRRKWINFNSGNWVLEPVLPWAHPDAFDAAMDELGKGYDWLAIAFTFAIPLGIQSSNRWVCSEFVAHLLGLDAQSINPGQLFHRNREMNAAWLKGFQHATFG